MHLDDVDASPEGDGVLLAHTEENASREAIEAERVRYAELFDSIPDAVIETDDLGRIAETNAAATELLGVAAAKVVRGTPIFSFLDPVQQASVRRALHEPPDHELLFAVRRRDGERRQVAARLRRHLKLGPPRLLWVLRDLTRSADLEQRAAASAAVALFQRLSPLQPLVGSPEARRSLIARVLESTEELLGVALVVQLEGDDPICGAAELGSRLAELERSTSDGPMTEAVNGARTVIAPAAQLTSRWLEVGTRALELRATGVTAVPILAAGEPIGAVAAWHRTDRNRDVLPALSVLADQISTAASNASLFAALQDTEENLRRALETRGVIEQAKGVLMQARGVTADEAFDLLRERSQRTNRKLRDVAIDLTEGRSNEVLGHPSG